MLCKLLLNSCPRSSGWATAKRSAGRTDFELGSPRTVSCTEKSAPLLMILIGGENRLEWMAVFWASVARGIQAVPVDYRFSPDLVQRISRESQPKLVIDNAGLDAIAALAPAMRFTPSEITAGDVVEI